MQWRSLLAIVGVLFVSVSACRDSVSSQSSDDAERAVLVRRATDLKSDVEKAGGMTAEHRRALEGIAQGITAWQQRTGRHDLAVSQARQSKPGTTALAVSGGGGVSTPCSGCPNMTFRDGRICFLEATSCRPNEIVTQYCWYRCVTVGPVPVR